MRACGTGAHNDIQHKYAWYTHVYCVLQAIFSFKTFYLKMPLASVFSFFVSNDLTDTLHIFPYKFLELMATSLNML